jgi:DNA-binding XRE family transcriptional regulator
VEIAKREKADSSGTVVSLRRAIGLPAHRRKHLYRLKEHRERRGLTQHELAKLSGVSRPTIAALELGYRRAYSRTAAKLARALKVKPEELV